MTTKKETRKVYCWKFFDQFCHRTTWAEAEKALDKETLEALKRGENVYSPKENLYFTVAPLLPVN